MGAQIVVHEPSADGRRLVTLADGGDRRILGLMRGGSDLMALLSSFGYDFTWRELRDPQLVEWQGGGPVVVTLRQAVREELVRLRRRLHR